MGFVTFMSTVAGRLLRVIAGILMIWLGVTQLQPPWSYIVAVLGVVPIFAGVMNLCLLGPLFHVDVRGRSLD